jgi:protein-L-isoaspartate(D-aspartate) O-methyltransferase
VESATLTAAQHQTDRSEQSLLHRTIMNPLYPSNLARAEEPGPVSRRLRAAFQRFPRSSFPQAGSQLERELDVFPESLVAPLLEALALRGTERVLEVGAPTLYMTALLSHLAGEVYSTAANPTLAQERARELGALGCGNVQVVHATPGAGWPMGAPYQVILVGAGAPEVPLDLVDQLDVGGRLVVPIGDSDAQMLECMRKRVGALDSETLGACRMKMLAGATPSPSSYPWTRPHET